MTNLTAQQAAAARKTEALQAVRNHDWAEASRCFIWAAEQFDLFDRDMAKRCRKASGFYGRKRDEARLAFSDESYCVTTNEDGSFTDPTTGELILDGAEPGQTLTAADIESIKNHGMTCDDCFEEGESERRADI